MRHENSSLYSRTGIRFALKLWILLSSGVVVFALLTTLFNLYGLTENQSIVLSFVLSGTLTLAYVFLLVRKSSSLVLPRPIQADRSKPLSLMQALRRLRLTFFGVSHADLIVDLMRIFGILGMIAVGAIVFLQHGLNILRFNRGIIFTIIFVVSLSLVVFHEFIYPFLRKESFWELEYRYRKLSMTNAINNVANASVVKVESGTLENIESTTLKAIKSFVEFAVLDKKKNHINVNLLIEHPYDVAKLICIRRTGKKSVPTFYSKEDMPTARRVIDACAPIYVAHFIPSIDTQKRYKMVWQIPLVLSLPDLRTITAIVAIDSTVPDHLSFDDNRQSLLFNLMPYIALLRFSLLQRYVYDIWDDVIKTDFRIGRPHVRSLTEADKASYLKYIEAEGQQDPNLDKESFDVILQHEGNSAAQVKKLKNIAAGLSEVTTGRKVFVALFPYVENNNRRIHG
jgi:hypothetical protein